MDGSGLVNIPGLSAEDGLQAAMAGGQFGGPPERAAFEQYYGDG